MAGMHELKGIGQHQRKHRLSGDERLMIYWGLSQGLPYRRIAYDLKCHWTTVRRWARIFRNDPGSVFALLPVLVRLGKDSYRCRICYGKIIGKKLSVQKHVLGHLFTPRQIADMVISPYDWIP